MITIYCHPVPLDVYSIASMTTATATVPDATYDSVYLSVADLSTVHTVRRRQQIKSETNKLKTKQTKITNNN